LSLAVLNEIREAFTTHAPDQTLIAAVIRGAGKRCFAAGGDLQELDSVRDEGHLREMVDAAFSALNSIRHFPVPVVAALNGDAIGGGAEFAVSCDMRVFARHARIAFVQGNLCVSPAWGGGVDLMRLVGDANALRLFSRAEFIDAEEARRLGLAQAVAEEDESIEHALERFMAPIKRMRPQVMRAFKSLGRAHRDGAGPQELREIEISSLMETWLHDDHWNAAAAIQAKIAAKR
jgi:enoyl-CoA hydratase